MHIINILGILNTERRKDWFEKGHGEWGARLFEKNRDCCILKVIYVALHCPELERRKHPNSLAESTTLGKMCNILKVSVLG